MQTPHGLNGSQAIRPSTLNGCKLQKPPKDIRHHRLRRLEEHCTEERARSGAPPQRDLPGALRFSLAFAPAGRPWWRRCPTCGIVSWMIG